MNRFPSRPCFWLFLFVGLLASLGAPSASGQIQVSVKPTRSIFIMQEPIFVDLHLTNQAGRMVELRNEGRTPWLRVRVENAGSGRPATSSGVQAMLEPIILPPGATTTRTINIAPLFTLEEPGTTAITLEVYFAEMDRTFVSNRARVEITDGREIWNTVVGVPGSNEQRRFSFLTAVIEGRNLAYVRVSDLGGYVVYATRMVGEYISLAEPQFEIDAQSQLHTLFLAGAQAYIHLVVSPEGDLIDRTIYQFAKARPQLVRTGLGEVGVLGGVAVIPRAVAAGDTAVETDAPRLSDRPPAP